MLNLENQKAVIVQFFGRRPLRRGALESAVGKKENRGIVTTIGHGPEPEGAIRI